MMLLEAVGGLIVFLVLAGVLGVARARVERFGALTLIWRFLTGHPWHGRAITDAGWLRPSTDKALTRTGHANRFHHRPRLHRTAMRTGPTLAVIAVGWAALAYRAFAVEILATAAAVVVGFAGWRVSLRIRRWRHHRQWVMPLHVMLAPRIGVPVEANPWSYLRIPLDRKWAEITLPKGWHGNERERDEVVAVVRSKLALREAEPKWQMTGPEHKVVFRQTEAPPKSVTLADVREAIEKAPKSTLVLGLGRERKPVAVSLASDSPHVAASMGTGGGKSTLARAMLAPWLHNGGIGLVLDVKLISHPWVWGLPNCACVDDPVQLHDAFCWLGDELERRNRVAKAATDVEGNMHGTPGPPLLIIAEELNLTMGKLRQYWKDVSGKGRSPALVAFDSVMFAGRAVDMHVVQIAQMLTARAAGSGEGRENAGIRIIARATSNNWKIMAPEHPYPGMTGIDGRVHVVASGQLRECQVTFMTMREARELATSGIVTPIPAGMPGATFAPRAAALPAAGTTEIPAQKRVILSEVAGPRGFLPVSLDKVRTLRHRDEDFPKSVGERGNAKEYDATELIDYLRSHM